MLLIVNFGGKIYPLWNVVMNKQILGKVIMYGAIAILLLCVYFISCERIYQTLNIPSDNPIEEAIEQVIEHETGINIDLTPQSKE